MTNTQNPFLTHLNTYFGYDSFRPLQKEIIENFFQKKDTVVLMPTGGGKSLCFQLPALEFEGITVVISPLIALMKDQVDSLNAVGIPATFLNSYLSALEQQTRTKDLQENNYKLLYISPERLGSPDFLEWMKNYLNISAFAVDEAHCISQWGHDFRPDYRNLSQIRKKFPQCPIIALTASATPRVRDDVIKALNLQNPEIFTSSFFRKNLNISVLPKKQMKEHIADIITERKINGKEESAIIYCFSRKETESLAEYLLDEGIIAMPYHAGLSDTVRMDTQEKFLKDEIPIITATIAFGMGVDKPNIRTVFHTVFPKTMEGYYQEIGRAGRDGLESECIMFFSEGDKQKHEYFLSMNEKLELKKEERKKMHHMLDFSRKKSCRWQEILQYFGETPSFEKCGKCDNCTNTSETFDATEISQKILSAIIKTESRFGKNYVLKVLKGSKEKNILANNHEKLSVWGIESKYSLDALQEIFGHLEEKNLIAINPGEFPTYRVSENGINFLQKKGEEKIELPKISARKKTVRAEDALEYHQECFQKLKSLRKFLADQKNVPPFVVFSDVSLQEMAFYLPTTKEDFGKISGVGQKKNDEFGAFFLKEISRAMVQFDLKSKPIPSRRERKIQNPNSGKHTSTGDKTYSRYEETKNLILQKNSLEKIAEEEGFQISTIINHIQKLLLQEKLTLHDISYLKPPENIFSVVQTAVQKHGTEKLKPLFDECQKINPTVGYDEIKLVLLFEG
jgi:ATP-dependent DNA helicase RecQ